MSPKMNVWSTRVVTIPCASAFATAVLFLTMLFVSVCVDHGEAFDVMLPMAHRADVRFLSEVQST
jgi:hypothetical protein